MITGFFLEIFYVFIAFVLSVLPSVALPAAWVGAFVLIWGYFSSFSFLFPMATVLAVLELALSFHIAILIFDFSLWLIHLIRGR